MTKLMVGQNDAVGASVAVLTAGRAATANAAKLPIWTPLRHARYRALWIANLMSNTGTWMQAMAAAWLMTSLTASPMMVASVQTATSLPIFLFAIIAGTLADIVDRPKFLLIVNVQMALTAFVISVLVVSGLMTPWLLLILTFMLGMGAAFMWPAWQASMSGLVDHAEIPAAATLNGLSYNFASIIGPALGGLLFKFTGAGMLFVLNAISFTGLIVVFYRWWKSPREHVDNHLLFFRAMLEGFKAVISAQMFHAILVNTFVIIFATSAFNSLLPLIVRDGLHLNASIYGVLMGCLGVGAVVGAFCLPTLRYRFLPQTLLSGAAIVFSLLLFVLATVNHLCFIIPMICISGLAWVAIVSTLNAAAQSSFPSHLRARALAVYMVVMYGVLALGSYIWGLLASYMSLSESLLTAAFVLGLSPLLALKWKIKNV